MKIEVTEEQYEAFNNGESITLVPPKKKHVIEYNEEDAFFIGIYGITNGIDGDNEDYLAHGRYRKTKENAEYSLKRTQQANRLEALIEDLQGELGVGDHTVCNSKGKYNRIYAPHAPHFIFGNVRMKEETANKVCDLLNSGRYSLDGK